MFLSRSFCTATITLAELCQKVMCGAENANISFSGSQEWAWNHTKLYHICDHLQKVIFIYITSWVFLWLYIDLGFIYYCLMCILNYQKHADTILYNFKWFVTPAWPWQTCQNFYFGSSPSDPWHDQNFGRPGQNLELLDIQSLSKNPKQIVTFLTLSSYCDTWHVP